MEQIVPMISSLGFPIVACVFMALYVKEQTKLNKEEIKEINKEHREEIVTFQEQMGAIRVALENNTLAIQRLCDRLVERGEKNEIK